MKRKRGICWRKGCERKYTAKAMVAFIVDKSFASLEGRFCDEHFADAWNAEMGQKKLAESFIAKTEHSMLPKRK